MSPSHRVGSISEELIKFDPGSCWQQDPLCDQQTGEFKGQARHHKGKNEIKYSEENRTKDEGV